MTDLTSQDTVREIIIAMTMNMARSASITLSFMHTGGLLLPYAHFFM
jgi:hypothetical protein